MPCITDFDYESLTMSTEKKMLLFGWIQHHLESKTFAEMRYIDESKSAFQVPWIHKSNRKWNENAAAVFKAWAEYKGKEENFSFTRAKTNFRMAMKYQPNISEIKRPKTDSANIKPGRGTKRKASEEEKCVKVYQIVPSDELMKKKSKKSHAQCAERSDWNSQDCVSTSATTCLPSTSSAQVKCEITGLPESTGNNNPCQPCPEVSLEALERLLPSLFPPLDLLPTFDGGFNTFPPCQELLRRTETSEDISNLNDDSTRYLTFQPIYESISDPVVSSTNDSFKENCSPGLSSDEASLFGDTLSLYPHTGFSQDTESDCQVSSSTKYSDDVYDYLSGEDYLNSISYIKAFELLENCVKSVTNVC